MNEVDQMNKFWTHMELLAYAVSLLTMLALAGIVWGLVIGFVARRERLPAPDRTAERTCYRVGGDCK
jgi:hypothetical protein